MLQLVSSRFSRPGEAAWRATPYAWSSASSLVCVRRAGIGVEAQPDALRHRDAELPGRGYDLSCGLGPDTGYLLEPRYPGGRCLADGAVSGGLDEPQPEPALGWSP